MGNIGVACGYKSAGEACSIGCTRVSSTVVQEEKEWGAE
jgi:hypothetical protein